MMSATKHTRKTGLLLKQTRANLRSVQYVVLLIGVVDAHFVGGVESDQQTVCMHRLLLSLHLAGPIRKYNVE